MDIIVGWSYMLLTMLGDDPGCVTLECLSLALHLSCVWLQIGLYSISFGFSWGPVGWLIPSEIHDLNTRAAGQSITVFTQLVSGATVTQSESSSAADTILWHSGTCK